MKMVITLIAFWAFATAAHGEVKSIPAGEPEKTLSCEEADDALTKEYNNVGGDPDDLLLAMAAVQRCAAEKYNAAMRERGSDRRAIPAVYISQEGNSRKVLFELVTLDSKDEAQVRAVCSAGATLAGIVEGGGDALMTQVVTVAGDYSCKSYIDAIMANDKLLIVAPTLIPGIKVTSEVLRRAGVSERDIRNGEDFIRNTPGRAVSGGVAVVTGGTVKIDKDFKCVRIMGKKVCR